MLTPVDGTTVRFSGRYLFVVSIAGLVTTDDRCHIPALFVTGREWPSFYAARTSDAVILREDRSLGMVRTEVICATCHSHLGHIFEGEGYDTPTDQRYCINSISLRLTPKE